MEPEDLSLLPQVNKGLSWMSERQSNRWVDWIINPWVSAESKNKAATHTQQGVGEQHLQSTVNIGNEQVCFL